MSKDVNKIASGGVVVGAATKVGLLGTKWGLGIAAKKVLLLDHSSIGIVTFNDITTPEDAIPSPSAAKIGFTEVDLIKFDEPKVFAYRASISDLAKYTKMLLTDDKLREEMGKNAYQHAMDNYQYQDIAKKALKHVEESIELK